MGIAEDKLLITQRYFDLINYSNVELYGRLKPHYERIQPILPLIDFIIERLNAVTQLAVSDLLWDAEIVYRSALETFIKLSFITAEEKERDLRTREFWVDLAEINKLKQSEQAKKNLKGFGHLESLRLAYAPLVLSEEEENKLRAKWSRINRQRVEQKWSFSEIIASLSKHPRYPESMTWGLAHCYRMASHVSHGDETGILIIKERSERNSNDRDAANFAHYLRLLSDSLAFTVGTAAEAMIFLKQDPKFFYNILNGLKDLDEMLEKYQSEVYNDKDYDKYRGKSE